jgi:hypothetical protein
MPTQEERIAALEKELKELKGEKPKPIAEPWQPIDWTARMSMPPSAIKAMVDAVPDRLVRDLVNDFRQSRPEPSSMRDPPSPREPVKGTGWVEPKVPDRSREFDLVDRIVESQVGGANDTSKLKP